MADEQEVIDARSRFGRRANDVTPLAARISGRRVADADKPVFAANLGKLAARIEPSRPLIGARRIVDESGLNGVWEKRKRFIRLAGEETSEVSAAGEYGSSGATFVRLAEAAGSLLAPTKQPEVVQREQQNAIRVMAVGSSFLPTYEPSSAVDRAAKSLLDDYAAILAKAISERTRIADLWSVLRDAPFHIQAFQEDELADHAALSPWRVVPESLLRPQFKDVALAGAFSFEAHPYYNWAEPSVPVGHVALRTKTRVFRLPEGISPWFSRAERGSDGFLSKKAQRWLRQFGWKPEGWLPEIEYDEDEGVGWEDVTVSSVRLVCLRACSDDEGSPTVRLGIWGDGELDYGPTAFSRYGWDLNAHEQQLAESNNGLTQVGFIDLDDHAFLQALHVKPFDPYGPYSGEDPEIFGLLDTPFLEPKYFEPFSREGWTADAAYASVLLSDDHQFYGKYANSRDVPVHPSSVGAALIWNLMSAPEAERFDKLLLEKCRIASESGLQFHEALVEEAREALRRI